MVEPKRVLVRNLRRLVQHARRSPKSLGFVCVDARTYMWISSFHATCALGRCARWWRISSVVLPAPGPTRAG